MAKVCDYCRATVARTDRGLQNLGRVADLANTPSLIAIGDEGTLRGRPFSVFGRVQLDYGQGPWDEYYVAFDHGQRWGWLAYAEGRWYATEKLEAVPIPHFQTLRLEQGVQLGSAGHFRIGELRSARVVSAEGELPDAEPPGFVRYYADAFGPQWAFATLDYADGRRSPEVFVGWAFLEPELKVTQLGPRSIHKVRTEQLKCPNCGGDIPKLSGDRVDRVGCPYCGALSEIATARVISQQERALASPDIPIGSKGTYRDDDYVCIAYLRRSTTFEGERYTWEEYLLWCAASGYHWLVKDPETGWSWATVVNLADVRQLSSASAVKFNGRHFALRNRNEVRVDYVLGEVYWKCTVGEVTRSSDYASGREVLTREEYPGEVKWSHSMPMPWPVIAQIFSLPVNGPGSVVAGPGDSDESSGGWGGRAIGIVFVVLILCAIAAMVDDDDGGGAGATVFGLGTRVGSSGGFRGGGIYSGGK